MHRRDEMPPHDEAAERALVGSFVGPQASEAIAFAQRRGVTPETFCFPVHRIIASEAFAMFDSGKAIDAVTLQDRLRAVGKLEQIGGPAEVDSFLDAASLLSSVPEHARIVVDQDVRRRVVVGLSSLAEAACTGEFDIGEIVQKGRDLLDSLNHDRREAMPRALSDFVTPLPDEESELIRHRLLCRTGAGLFVSTTGAGKSTFTLGAALHFALGRDFFGLSPARRLQTLIFQAENDDGDVAEFRDGALAGLRREGIGEEDCRTALAGVRVIREVCATGPAFGNRLRGTLTDLHRGGWMPDLVIIDPALAYLGGGTNKDEVVSTFLRNILNPILLAFNIGAMVVTHTGKPRSGKDGAISDPAYFAIGHSEWSNWARFIAVLLATKERGVFKLALAKRGSRARWRTPDGSPTTERHVAQNLAGHEIYWMEPTDAQLAAVESMERVTNDNDSKLAALIPTGKAILDTHPDGLGKTDFQKALRAAKVPARTAPSLVGYGEKIGAWYCIRDDGFSTHVTYFSGSAKTP